MYALSHIPSPKTTNQISRYQGISSLCYILQFRQIYCLQLVFYCVILFDSFVVSSVSIKHIVDYKKKKSATLDVFSYYVLLERCLSQPVTFGTRQFQVILPTVSLEDSGVLKVLFAHFAGKSYLVHYMYHCLVFSQSFTTNNSLSTFNAFILIR